MGEWKWTRKRELAAQLVAAGDETLEEIAVRCGMAVTTLRNWRKHPAFVERVNEHVAAWRAKITSEGIAVKENRVFRQRERHRFLEEIVERRRQNVLAHKAAATPGGGEEEALWEVPGAETGLLVKRVSRNGSVSFGVDTELLNQLLDHEERVARELKQWTEKHEFDHTVAFGLFGDLSDDELDRRIAELEARKAAAGLSA